MSNLDDSFEKLLGRQPSDAERQNLYRVRDALGLKNNDALWLVLLALQHYQSLYENIPDRIETAAARAQADVTSAIAKLVPAVESAVREGARSALAQEALGRSMITLIAGSVVVGLVFAAGVMYGARIFAVAAAGQLGWAEFWTQIGWSIALGTAAPGLFLIGVVQLDDERTWWQYLALALAVAAVAIPAIRLILLLVT